MSFGIEDGEPLPSALRRVVRSEIERGLDATRGGSPESLHEARRALKRIRAVLRLVRDPLGSSAWKAEDVAYRDLGRALADARNAAMLLGALERVEREAGEALQGATHELRRWLVDRREASREALVSRDTLGRVAAGLREGIRRRAAWTLTEPPGFPLIRPGLQRTYGEARAAFLRARRRREGAEVFHEWRKRTKDVRHQVELLRGSWPPLMDAAAQELHRLSDRLGEANDLSVLLEEIAREPVPALAPLATEALRQAASELRRRLWAEALPLGERAFAEPPAAYARRLACYWDAWRAPP